ncbi:MAG: hypothetical protein CSB44_04895 [Gammaproteobacteria bacterium]|nr:MAG: hypothetical protein CSB44_04895 [Gammaproteobacteria bacterium]
MAAWQLLIHQSVLAQQHKRIGDDFTFHYMEHHHQFFDRLPPVSLCQLEQPAARKAACPSKSARTSVRFSRFTSAGSLPGHEQASIRRMAEQAGLNRKPPDAIKNHRHRPVAIDSTA